jgi:hypothetical protein
MSPSNKPPEPPRLSKRVVFFAVPRRLRDEALEGLAGGFGRVWSSSGATRARWYYRRQALCLVVRYSLARAVDVIEACAFGYRVMYWTKRLLEWLFSL